jgi:non-ribosomal peptide synthase protein (TIGR01720 family)
MITGIKFKEEQPLLPAQKWWLDTDSDNVIEMTRYNADTLCRITTEIDLDIMNRVIKELVKKHDVLRSTFHKTVDRGWVQVCEKEATVPDIKVYDLSDCNADGYLQQIEYHCKLLQDIEPFDLQRGPLLKPYFFIGPCKKDNFLWILVHHLLIDGISTLILSDEVFRLYKQLAAGEDASFPLVHDPSQNFIPDIVEQYFKKYDPAKESYWRHFPVNKLADLPLDYNKPLTENTIESLDNVFTCFDEVETNCLINCKKILHIPISLQDLLLCATGHSILNWTGGMVVDIETYDSGRKILEEFTGKNFTKNLGWFALSRLIIINREDNADCIHEQLKSYHEQIKKIPNRGFGLDFIKTYGDELNLIKDYKRPPLLFNFFGRVNLNLKFPGAQRVFIDTGYFMNPKNAYSHLVSASAYILENKLTIDWRYSRNLFAKETIQSFENSFRDFLKLTVFDSKIA